MVITKTINKTSYKIKVDNTGRFSTEVLFSEFAKKEVVSAASLNALVRKINEKASSYTEHYAIVLADLTIVKVKKITNSYRNYVNINNLKQKYYIRFTLPSSKDILKYNLKSHLKELFRASLSYVNYKESNINDPLSDTYVGIILLTNPVENINEVKELLTEFRPLFEKVKSNYAKIKQLQIEINESLNKWE